MRAIITGITGFVGQHLAEHLLAEGDEVFGTSQHASWPDFAPEHLRRDVPVVRWDVTQPDETPGIAQSWQATGPDAIYHLTALSVPDDCGAELPSSRALAVNVGGTAQVLELAAKLPSAPRVLVVSSSHVYPRPQEDDAPMAETAAVAPHSGYGWSKWLAELVSVRFAPVAGLQVVVARSFQHTGPGQVSRLMLPNWAEQFARHASSPVRVYNLSTTIDLSDVRDVVRAYRRLVLDGQPGEVYNVGSGRKIETGQVFETLRQMADPNRRVLELRPGQRYDPIADIRKLVACTGWQPQIRLEESVADTLEFWRRRQAAQPSSPGIEY